MAHMIDMSNNRANVAYRGEKPWHGLGFEILAGDSVEVIRQKAGLNFDIIKGETLFRDASGNIHSASSLNRSVLYRSDTLAPLSVMSEKHYHIVQPSQIIEFIGEAVEAMGWSIETAGSLYGGRKVWALAKIGDRASVGNGDDIDGYLLAATACDGSMASEFMFTSVRVVCNNTLHLSITDADQSKGTEKQKARVKVYHATRMDQDALDKIKAQLGIAPTVWAGFIEQAKLLASIKVTDSKAVQILRSVYDDRREEKEVAGEVLTDQDWLRTSTPARTMIELFSGQGLGSELMTARGTAWGLVNATSEYYDHVASKADNRLNSAWFGTGANRKQQVVDACFEMAD